MRSWIHTRRAAGLAVLLLLAPLASARAQEDDSSPIINGRKNTLDGMTLADFKAAMPQYFPHVVNGKIRPADVPDIFGPGAVLNVGNVTMKITNNGIIGNPFPNLSSDPAAQWPGVSGTEYIDYFGLAVGAVNPLATDPTAVRRVSYIQEWRPPTLDPVDHIYRAYDGIVNGTRFVNDDGDHDPLTGDARVDEDFLDGRDDDGDGKIDEDYAAIGQQMFSCLMRDDTPEAINASSTEKHVPLGLECRQLAWAYSIPGYTDFNVVEWTIFNRSGHVLDSLVVGGIVDMDVGPTSASSYWQDDIDLSGYPSGEFIHATAPTDLRMQDSTMRAPNTPNGVNPDSALCPRFPVRVNAFSICDDDGDLGKSPGIPTFMLVNHTVDPTGQNGPARVGFTAFRCYTVGTPFNQGGRPSVDQERFQLMVGTPPNNIDPNTGFINAPPGDQKGDQVDWWSTGPWRNVPDGGSVQVTVAFGVALGTRTLGLQYAADYASYAGESDGALKDQKGVALLAKYPSLANCLAIQIAYEGIYENRPDWPLLTNGHGRETPIKPKPGEPAVTLADCHDISAGQVRTVTSTQPEPDWFDFDCDYCTGVYNSKSHQGMFHHTWNADAPPPNPAMNVAATYNYSDNPNPQRITAAGDRKVTLAWDNLSEVSPDPKTGWFDFRGYRIWKVSGWTRPVGSAGPSDDNWSLIGEFRQFWYRDAATNGVIPRNYTVDAQNVQHCPKVFVPNYVYPDGHRDTATVDICLNAGDLWDRQSGQILRPDTTFACVNSPTCDQNTGCILGRQDCSNPGNRETRTHYTVGRYQYVDREVQNGFIYFYSVTAFDSTGSGNSRLELSGRRSGVEAEGVTPQSGTMSGKHVWVVPNPYRGYANIQDRPSAWDLTPNATDPTGTHIDFMGLPAGPWTIRIYTVSGDLVTTIRSTDAVNESVRPPVTGPDGKTRPGYNRQQDSANDGEARWNLISRNGQDVVSGIYIFTVQSSQGTQRGRFVIIR